MRNYEDILDAPEVSRKGLSFSILLLLASVLLFLSTQALTFQHLPDMPPGWVYNLIDLSVLLAGAGLVSSWPKRKERNVWRKVLMVLCFFLVVIYLIDQLYVAFLTYFA